MALTIFLRTYYNKGRTYVNYYGTLGRGYDGVQITKWSSRLKIYVFVRLPSHVRPNVIVRHLLTNISSNSPNVAHTRPQRGRQ